MPDESRPIPDPSRGDITRPPSIWRSRSLRLMLGVTAVGLGLWAYALATAPAATPATDPALASGMSATSHAPAARSRLIDDSAPATFRLGLSFVVGFFLAWMLRKVIKTVLLVGGLIGTLLIILKATGVVNLNFDALESQVDEGLEVAQQTAGRARDFILGYVPSAASAAAGMFFGARRRS